MRNTWAALRVRAEYFCSGIRGTPITLIGNLGSRPKRSGPFLIHCEASLERLNREFAVHARSARKRLRPLTLPESKSRPNFACNAIGVLRIVCNYLLPDLQVVEMCFRSWTSRDRCFAVALVVPLSGDFADDSVFEVEAAPVTCTSWPTCSASLEVSPWSVYILPESSVRV